VYAGAAAAARSAPERMLLTGTHHWRAAYADWCLALTSVQPCVCLPAPLAAS
jgi:hypothetical protein